MKVARTIVDPVVSQQGASSAPARERHGHASVGAAVISAGAKPRQPPQTYVAQRAAGANSPRSTTPFSSAGGPPPADPHATVTLSAAALDAYVNYILYGTAWSSDNGKQAGDANNSVNLTYSFIDPSISANNYYPNGQLKAGSPYSPFTPDQITSPATQQAFRDAMAAWAAVSGVSFSETTPESSGTFGSIRAGIDSQNNTAYAYEPIAGQGALSGDVMLGGNQSGVPHDWNTADVSPGTWSFATMLHELGHALGFRHPHDPGRDATLFSTKANSGKLLDQLKYTVMSYRDSPGASTKTGYTIDYYPTTPMVNDIAAVQYLYGVNGGTNTGSDTCSFSDGQKYFQTIYDMGGNDTIDASTETQSVKIDLRAGNFSALGDAIHWYKGKTQMSARDFVGIAYNSVIENATGGSGNDTMYGNAADNNLGGGAGNDLFVVNPTASSGTDTIDGGNGGDTLVLPDMGVGNTWTVAGSGGTTTFTSSIGGYSVAAQNVEFVALSATGVKLSIDEVPASLNTAQFLETVNKFDDLGTIRFTRAATIDGKPASASGMGLYHTGNGTLFVAKGVKPASIDPVSGNVVNGVTATTAATSLVTSSGSLLSLASGETLAAFTRAKDGSMSLYIDNGSGAINILDFDASGNQSGSTRSVAYTSPDIVSLELSLKKDLNHDGITGAAVTQAIASTTNPGIYVADLGGSLTGNTFLVANAKGLAAGKLLKAPAFIFKNADNTAWSLPGGNSITSYSWTTVGKTLNSITLTLNDASTWIFASDGKLSSHT